MIKFIKFALAIAIQNFPDCPNFLQCNFEKISNFWKIEKNFILTRIYKWVGILVIRGSGIFHEVTASSVPGFGAGGVNKNKEILDGSSSTSPSTKPYNNKWSSFAQIRRLLPYTSDWHNREILVCERNRWTHEGCFECYCLIHRVEVSSLSPRSCWNERFPYSKTKILAFHMSIYMMVLYTRLI